MTNALIIDLSHWDGHVDFDVLKLNGVSGVYLKASEGLATDTSFAAFWLAAKNAGLPRGAYHFLRSDVDIGRQSDFFCALLRADPGELRPVADIEQDRGNIGPQRLAAASRTFVLTVKASLGVDCMIYTSPGFWGPLSPYTPWASAYDLWVAHYGVNEPRLPAPWTRWTIWQFSDNTAMPGVEAKGVDKSWFAGDTAAFGIYLRGIHPPPAPEPTDAVKLAKLWAAHPELH